MGHGWAQGRGEGSGSGHWWPKVDPWGRDRGTGGRKSTPGVGDRATRAAKSRGWVGLRARVGGSRPLRSGVGPPIRSPTRGWVGVRALTAGSRPLGSVIRPPIRRRAWGGLRARVAGGRPPGSDFGRLRRRWRRGLRGARPPWDRRRGLGRSGPCWRPLPPGRGRRAAALCRRRAPRHPSRGSAAGRPPGG